MHRPPLHSRSVSASTSLSRRSFLTAAGATVSAVAGSSFRRSAAAAPASSEVIRLFNGRDLQGWIPKIRGYRLGENFGRTFRVEDGLLKVRYDQYDRFDERFGHLFFEKPFSRYRLRVEYRFVGEQIEGGPGWAFRNSGIMVHGQDPATMAVDQKFPVSIEVQLLGGRAKGKRPTANLCTPGTHVVMNGKLLKRHCTNSTSPTFRGDEWVTVEVEVRGNERIRHYVNGKVVLEYTQPQLDLDDPDARRIADRVPRMLSGGTISLQSESHPIDFRKVELTPLP
ncbi:MAG TPA: DUF1080 domain-containing protein [Planctomycetaceae bacterium]|nr:DUF1080 domain-containing protein [Planctomycetaceae bacterium]